jgi:spore coat protein U-like protein
MLKFLFNAFQQPIQVRKNDMKKLAIIGAILTVLPGLAAATQPAFADTATSTFQVTLTITKGCTVSTPSTISLGNTWTAATLNSSGATGTTTLTVNCTTGIQYNIGFSGTNDVASSAITHYMKGTTSGFLIPYQLTDATLNAANTSPLTAASATNPSLIKDKGTGSAQSKTIQAAVIAGSIPGGAVADAYYDTVTLTLSY